LFEEQENKSAVTSKIFIFFILIFLLHNLLLNLLHNKSPTKIRRSA
jgi:hypothetical protein